MARGNVFGKGLSGTVTIDFDDLADDKLLEIAALVPNATRVILRDDSEKSQRNAQSLPSLTLVVCLLSGKLVRPAYD